uniref:Uncharacterized protein n=1 Tax=Plectus sambesii TaxID=2011161 RepID=A0A914V100_9BILA
MSILRSSFFFGGRLPADHKRMARGEWLVGLVFAPGHTRTVQSHSGRGERQWAAGEKPNRQIGARRTSIAVDPTDDSLCSRSTEPLYVSPAAALRVRRSRLIVAVQVHDPRRQRNVDLRPTSSQTIRRIRSRRTSETCRRRRLCDRRQLSPAHFISIIALSRLASLSNFTSVLGAMGGRLLLAACSVILLLERHLTLAHDNSPLVFEFMQTDAQRVKIYWDPMVSVQKVLELSNREVGFVADNATGELKEKLGSWRELVSDQDEDDGSKRYIFLKNAMCDEVDWQVKWTDGQGQMHGPSIYRMPPSPMPWTPEGKLRVDSIIYDPTHDAVFIKTSWNITDDKLNGQKKLSEYKPLLELQECRHFLKEAAPQPGMMENGDLVIPGAYGRAECSFYFRLSVTARNEELKCRDVFHTTDSQSVEIDASCGVLAGFDCPPQPKFPCDMDCNPLVAPVAEYRVDKQGFSQPAISIKWSSISAPDRPSVGTALRHAQIDRTHMDYPIKEFNATVEILEPNIFQFELEPYTKDPGASYGVQVCIFFEKACNDAELNWMTVGQSQILFNKFIDELPPPTPRKEIKGDS